MPFAIVLAAHFRYIYRRKRGRVMKYETVKAGTTINYMDEAEVSPDNWERLPNHMVGLQVCGIRVRRPVSETFRIIDFQKANEGDRVGPFNNVNDASSWAWMMGKSQPTHMEHAQEGIYLVVNRKYERGD